MQRTSLVGALLLVFLAGTIALTVQRYVGGATIYAASLEERRAMLHEAILHNSPPEGQTWQSLGANGDNTRIGTVYVAEAVRRLSGLSLQKTYFLLETAALAIALVSIFLYLRRASTAQLALVGLLFVSAIQPLTYAFYYFHPWDRPSLIGWVWVLWFIREDKPVWAAAILPFAVLIKWDIIVLPALYLLVYARRGAFPRVLATTVALGLVGIITYVVARELLPGGTNTAILPGGALHPSQQWQINLRDIRSLGAFYPPMLGLLLPAIAATVGLRTGNRFERASFCFGLALLVPMFLQTNFREFRAEMPVLVLLLPLALRGVAMLLDSSSGTRAALSEPASP